MSLRTSQWFRRAAIGVTVRTVLLFGLRAGLNVVNGGAADTYTNVKGVQISWGSALVFVVALLVASCAALVARWRHRRGVSQKAAKRTDREAAIVGVKGSGAPKDMPSNKSLERTREG
jgi:hypothetical protein